MIVYEWLSQSDCSNCISIPVLIEFYLFLVEIGFCFEVDLVDVMKLQFGNLHQNMCICKMSFLVAKIVKVQSFLTSFVLILGSCFGQTGVSNPK